MKQKLSQSEAGKLGAIASAKTNAAKKQQRIIHWNNNPKLCKFCTIPLQYDKRYNDFCTQTCGANYLNSVVRGFVLSDNKKFNCLFCNNEFDSNGTEEHKYCSRKCMFDFWWQETKKKILLGEQVSNKKIKKYLIEYNSGKCQICNLTEWTGRPMPLVLDHINGNSEDNSLNNLRVICNNCDALTDHYKGKNAGNGRAKRRQRYRDGKSY